MTNKPTSIFPILLGFAIAIGIVIGSYFDFENKLALFKNNKEQKIKKLIGYIQNKYIEEVATDSLLDDAIKNIISKLDPHSVYMSKEEQIQASENMNGLFVGIGIKFLILNDTIVVSDVIAGSPASVAGLKRGDRVIFADQQSLLKKDLINSTGNQKDDWSILSDIVAKSLRGAKDTEVLLDVYRKTIDKELIFKIKRVPIPIRSVNATYMINQHLGYIQIDRFSRNTAIEFNIALCDLLEKGMTALVLDLRGNPGGFIEVAERITDEFLPKGHLIFSTKNQKGEKTEAFATQQGDFEQGNLYVLIDRNSASASEVVAGALQDNDRAVIVGRRSFGKALVQEEMDLGDGSIVRLTTSEYLTASGRTIQKPYSKNKAREDYLNETNHRILTGELLSKELIEVNEKQEFKTISGRTVYGKSGIIPDIFVPLNKFEIDQLTSGYHQKIRNYTIRYLDEKRVFFEKMTLNHFMINYEIEDAVVDDCIQKLGLDWSFQKHKKKRLKVEMKSILAEHIFDGKSYYKIAHTQDKMIQKVIEEEKNMRKPTF